MQASDDVGSKVDRTAFPGPMQIEIEPLPQYLRITVRHRETPEQTRQVIEAALAALQQHSRSNVLIRVFDSRSIFQVERYSLSRIFADMAGKGLRVALVSDASDLYASHQYIEALAAQRGLTIRAFRAEETARAWLLGSTLRTVA